jgi:diguanylate cyclase (GGDEF)-like protein
MVDDLPSKNQTDSDYISKTSLNELINFSQFAHGLTENELTQKALESAVQLTLSEFAYVHFVNQDENTLQLILWSDGVEEACEALDDLHNSIDQAGVWADCVQSGNPVIHNDFQGVTDKKGYPKDHIHLFRHASVPVYDKGKLRLIFGIGNKETDYNSTDVKLLGLLGHQLVKILHAQQVENAYIRVKKQYDQLVQNIPIGIFRARTTLEGSIVFEYVNQQFCEMMNLSQNEIYKDSNSVFNFINPEDLNILVDLIRETTQTKKPLIWEGRIITGDPIKWLRMEARPEGLFKNEIVWHGALTDTTERNQAEIALREANTLLENRLVEIEQLQVQLREQAIRDYLTGLFNRRYLDETIIRELARAKRDRFLLSVVMMDIDHFKSINDTYGHEAGDTVLIQLGALLKEYSRASDIACRYGGDEFCVVMPGASATDALKRADEWRIVFEKQRFITNGHRFATTLSMGIASYPLHASSQKGVFQAADQALYQAKIHNNRVLISRRLSTKKLRPINQSED